MAGRPRAGNTAIFGLLMGCLLPGMLALPGCTPAGQDDGRPVRSAESEAEWRWLQDAKARLDAERARLAQLQATAPEPGSTAAGDVERLAEKVSALSAELNQRLVAFINANAPAAGPASGGGKSADDPRKALNERLRAAIHMKSGEDALLAREFIEQGGDYRRAIEIYETALATDPDNESLRKELEAARARRYITDARFKAVHEGMTEDEVRRLLGPPNRQDVREYPERGVTAWFYPKDASGAAAAVWFHSKGGKREVYLLDFEAIKPAGGPAAAPAPGAAPPAAPAAPAAPTPAPLDAA